MESKKQQWSGEETQCFLGLWSSEEVQDRLEGASRTKPIFEKIRREMAAAGFERSVDQLLNKLKKLKKEFRDQKRQLGRSGSRRPKKSPHYELFNSVLCDRPANQVTGALNSATASTLVDSVPQTAAPAPESLTKDLEALCPQPASPGPSRNSPCGSSSSSVPSCSTPLPPCNSSASASAQTIRRKRKRDANADVLQYLERSEERFLAQNQLDRDLVTSMLQRMEKTSTALIGLMGRVVSVLEGRTNKMSVPSGLPSTGVQQLLVKEEEFPPEQQEGICSLAQEDPEFCDIKKEEEELWTR